jgi:hypothetical protein
MEFSVQLHYNPFWTPLNCFVLPVDKSAWTLCERPTWREFLTFNNDNVKGAEDLLQLA